LKKRTKSISILTLMRSVPDCLSVRRIKKINFWYRLRILHSTFYILHFISAMPPKPGFRGVAPAFTPALE